MMGKYRHEKKAQYHAATEHATVKKDEENEDRVKITMWMKMYVNMKSKMKSDDVDWYGDGGG